MSEIAAIGACMGSGDVTLKACFDEQLVPLSNLAKADVFRGMYAGQLTNVYELFDRKRAGACHRGPRAARGADGDAGQSVCACRVVQV